MASRNGLQPPARILRQAGWLVAGLLALAGHLINPTPAALFLQLCGAVLFAVATVRPRALTGIYLLAQWMASPILSLWSRNNGSVAVERRPRRFRPRKRPATS